MRTSFALIFAVLSACLVSFTHLSQELQDADTAIRAAVESYYVKGLQTRQFELIRTICIPEAMLMGSRQDGELRATTLDQWSARFDPARPPFNELSAEIEKIDIVGTAAQVRIDFVVDGKTRITDFLNMVKISGDWRIVNIIDY